MGSTGDKDGSWAGGSGKSAGSSWHDSDKEAKDIPDPWKPEDEDDDNGKGK